MATAIFPFKQERLNASETTASTYEAFILSIPLLCFHESLYLVPSMSWETDALTKIQRNWNPKAGNAA